MYYKLKHIVWEPFQKSGVNETHFFVSFNFTPSLSGQTEVRIKPLY